MDEPIIALSALSYHFGRQQIFDELSLPLYRGEIALLCGENGIGKTTLLRLFAGELALQKGKRLSAAPLRIAFVPEHATFYPQWTVALFLHWWAETNGVAQEHAERVIARCGLNDMKMKYCRQLSRGYEQRLALAQALLIVPDVLLLDEPANGLDSAQQQVLQQILQETAAAGVAILLTNHHMSAVFPVADKVWQLKEGRCREIVLPPRGLWAQWQSEEQAEKQCQHYAVLWRKERYSVHALSFAQLSAAEGLEALQPAIPSAVINLLLAEETHVSLA